MKQYSVEVLRKGYRVINISVEANSEKEAKLIALNKASSADFPDEFSYDYEIEYIIDNGSKTDSAGYTEQDR